MSEQDSLGNLGVRFENNIIAELQDMFWGAFMDRCRLGYGQFVGLCLHIDVSFLVSRNMEEYS